MAEKKRGRYKEYMRHSNPFKFPAARRQNVSKRYLRSIRRSQNVSLHDHDFECEDDVSIDCDVTMTTNASLSCSNSDEQFYHMEDEVLSTDCGVFTAEILQCDSTSDDEPLQFTERERMYARFIKEDDSSSDIFSDVENSGGSDSESLSEECEKEDDVLYSGSPITTTSSIVLILSFVMKYKLTKEAFRDLLAVIEAHCPRPNNCKKEVKKLFEFVSQAKGNIVKHFFCSYCKAYFGKGTQDNRGNTGIKGTCHICGKNLATTHGFFIEAPIVKQLQTFFGDPEFVSGLKYRFQRVKRDDSNMEDVYDGALYQKEFKSSGFLSEPYNISVKLNTDGVAIFHSSQFGVWPLFLLVNELPPAMRINNKFRVFGGLWFGEEKPFFSTFLKPFVNALQETEINGIEVVLPNGQRAKSKVKALSSHFDLPARAGVLEQVTYVGHDSCCYCDEHGETVKTGPRGHVMSFPFRNTASGHAKSRTAELVTSHSFEALEKNSVVSGFKAPSPLLQLPSFDIVNGIGIDSMHCVFLGVVKQLVGLWFNSKHSTEMWYCGNSVQKVDMRLLEIRPPSVITRVPRSLEHHVKFWKATEYRNWLYFYSLPCMKGILDDEYYQHYALLVGGIVLLSGRSISPEQLELAGNLLIHFVEMFDAYYGSRYVLMNQHMLLHLKESVLNHGPLWSSSLFVFEDWNGDIGHYFHGTQNIAGQIMTAVTSQQQLPELIKEMPPGSAKDLVMRLQGQLNSLKLHEDWGTTPAAIDCALTAAEKHDVQITIHTDTLNESACVEQSVEAFKGRTIHTYHSEGAGGGHAPDIIKVCSEENVIPSSTNPTRPFTRNTIDEHLDMLMVCHHLDKNLKEDVAFAESRIRAETIAAEDILHDMGAISIISSDSQAMGRVGEVICRTWQTADKMKKLRGKLSDEKGDNDNIRVRRYVAKYTINPALAHGMSHVIGSIEVGKLADLVLWNPALFGSKPEIVVKGGQIAWSQMGNPNASIPTPQPVRPRPMFGAFGAAIGANSVVFVSQECTKHNVCQTYGISKKSVAVKGCRTVKKKDMVLNNYLPKLTVDPQTYKVHIVDPENPSAKEHITCSPAETIPMAQRFFIF